jgi:hypothetical protein
LLKPNRRDQQFVRVVRAAIDPPGTRLRPAARGLLKSDPAQILLTARGEYQRAEREVKRNYPPGGIWQRGTVGLGRTSPSLAPRQVAGGGSRGVRPREIVIASFAGQLAGTGTGWGGGPAAWRWGPWAVPINLADQACPVASSNPLPRPVLRRGGSGEGRGESFDLERLAEATWCTRAGGVKARGGGGRVRK